jgi:hypothetical protein
MVPKPLLSIMTPGHQAVISLGIWMFLWIKNYIEALGREVANLRDQETLFHSTHQKVSWFIGMSLAYL